MTIPINNNELKNFFHRIKNASYRKCLWHSETCKKKAIRAHSIQNSSALNHVSDDGHVVMVCCEIQEEGVLLDFKKTGRNTATTFCGLCSKHDAELFRPIDTSPIDITNPEHLFLLAYRSVLKEFHTQLQGAFRVQSLFEKGLNLGEFASDGHQMIEATQQLHQPFQFYKTVCQFHDAYVSRNWSAIKTNSISIETQKPSIAASGVFMPLEVEPFFDPENPSLMIFNLIPQKQKLIAIGSWLKTSHPTIDLAFAPILTSTNKQKLYILSKFILKYIENFVISPSLYDSYSKNQLHEIQRYYAANSNGIRNEWDNDKLNLFDSC